MLRKCSSIFFRSFTVSDELPASARKSLALLFEIKMTRLQSVNFVIFYILFSIMGLLRKSKELLFLTNRCDKRVYRNLARCPSDCESRLIHLFLTRNSYPMREIRLSKTAFSTEAALMGQKVCSAPSKQQHLEQHLLRAAMTEERLCCCTLPSHHGCTQLCLKVFMLWHNHLSASVFVSTRTLSLLVCKIFFPADLPASSVLVRAGWLTEARGRNALPKWWSPPASASRIITKWLLAFGASGHVGARGSGRHQS